MLSKLKIKSMTFYRGKEQSKCFLKFAVQNDMQPAWTERFGKDAGDMDNLSGERGGIFMILLQIILLQI